MLFFCSGSLDYEYPNLVPFEYETHGGDDVAVFASGPWQHLFTASYEQSVIPHLMAYAMCLDDRKHENCNKRNSGVTVKPNKYYIVSLCAVILVVTTSLRF